MSPVFGLPAGRQGKRKSESTVAIFDIESGSVGAGLVRISKKQKPKLFGQTRASLGVRGAPTASALMGEIEKEMHHSLLHLSAVAARMRANAPLSGVGEIDRVAVFLHAPWISSSIVLERPMIRGHDDTLEHLREQVSDILGSVPATFHAFSSTAAPVMHGIFNNPQTALVCSIGGEVAELSLLRSGALAGHATIPQGFNTILRTLASHAGLSRAEAISAISLARSTRELEWAEALTHAIGNFSSEAASAMQALQPLGAGEASRVFVLAPHPSAEWFARMFTEDTHFAGLFAPGSTVRPVLARHASPHLAAHPKNPDLPLLLESLFVDTRFAAQ